MNVRLSPVLRSGPLAVPSFRLLACGQFASTIGDYCYAVALPWLVLSEHASPILLGVVLACYGTPRVVLIPAGGALADKVGPRILMLCADVERCVVVLVLTLLAAKHTISLAALGPPAALIGAGEGLFLPGSYSIMPLLLNGDQLAAGNALSTAAASAGSLIGPALGGTLVAATGASTAALGIDAASFAVSALTLGLMPTRAVPGSYAATSSPAGAAGNARGSVLSVLRQSRAVQVILATILIANIGISGMETVAIPALAHAKWGAVGFGSLLASSAVGMLVGSLAGGRTGRLRVQVLFSSAVFAIAVASCLIPYTGEAGAVAAMLVIGGCTGLANVIILTVVQSQLPPVMLGRVMSAFMLCAFGCYPLSVSAAGLIVRHLGPAPFFPAVGAMLATAMAVGITQRQFRQFGALASREDSGAG